MYVAEIWERVEIWQESNAKKCSHDPISALLCSVVMWQRPFAQIPRCASSKSHNAFCDRNVHMCALWIICLVHYGNFTWIFWRRTYNCPNAHGVSQSWKIWVIGSREFMENGNTTTTKMKLMCIFQGIYCIRTVNFACSRLCGRLNI